MAFVQDDARKQRFTILVDRSHGFSSMKSGRLETLVERRTVYDDARGVIFSDKQNKIKFNIT